MAPLDQRIRDAIRRDKNGPTAQLLGDVIAEIERLQADAGRLDWLGANATRVADSERYLPLSVYWGAGTHRDVRAAIDKAMKDAS